MNPIFQTALRITWGLLLLYWLWSARTAKRPSMAEPVFKQIVMYWLPLIAAVLHLGPGEWFGHNILREQFVSHSIFAQSVGLAVCVAGAFLACWSRYLLGTNWSSVVELKHDHELIENGPYKHVRHPIYAGLLTLFFGNAILVGDWRGLIAVAIIFASFWRKLRLEEQWLTQQFGNRYRDYVNRTKALVPGIL